MRILALILVLLWPLHQALAQDIETEVSSQTTLEDAFIRAIETVVERIQTSFPSYRNTPYFLSPGGFLEVAEELSDTSVDAPTLLARVVPKKIDDHALARLNQACNERPGRCTGDPLGIGIDMFSDTFVKTKQGMTVEIGVHIQGRPLTLEVYRISFIQRRNHWKVASVELSWQE